MKKVLLLDLDGTLIDSNEAHALSWVETFQEFGFDVKPEKVRPLIGMGSDQLIPKVISIDAKSEMAEKLSKRRGEIFRKSYLKKLKPFRAARELVEKVLEQDIEIVVATSASASDLKGLLQQIGIQDLIKHATTSDDADKSKPHPDILEEAMKKVKARPEQCFMLGDTPYDILAADRAGVKALGFTCGGWDADHLHGALDVYEGPWELCEQFETSALAQPLALDQSSVFQLRL